MHPRAVVVLAAFVATFCLRAQPAPSRLELKPGDHIALIGNALPDRMQHTGYFETLVHAKFPNHELVFRNLAAAGDEVATRHRSENFGTPDDWLTRAKSDVILAFFGYGESFSGAAGVEKFKTDLDRFLKETAAKNYSGKGAPRVVLVSPIAGETHQDPNFIDAPENNPNLDLYARAMADVARANQVLFVDLFAPSKRLFAESARAKRSLTIDGHLLSDEGDRALAPVLFEGLFGERPADNRLDKLRAAVNEKNRQWHQRYRTIDGYNVYGGRSALAYQPGKGGFITDRNAAEPHISNYKVMQEEMSQRDVLTANRDKRVWAVARGSDLTVDDSNLPVVTRVQSNKPGANADESHEFLSGEEAISKMTVHSGMKVNLFADEKQFPDLIKPVQMAWDTRGRLWVAVWPNYPERTPTSTKGDSLLIFEDTNGDGRADKRTEFIGDLNAPTGFQFYKDGVLVMQAPDLWFVRDTDGDGRADTRERILMGLDSADSHHTANALCFDPGGSVYLSDGVFHRSQVETVQGVVRNNDAAIYRFEPATRRFETYVSYGFANPHGRVFDYWGNDIVTDATGNNSYFGAAFSGFLDYPAKHAGMQEFWNRPSRPCPATGLLTSRHFPEEFQGNFLNINVIGFQGIFRVKVSEEGSGIKGETMENLISSTDPNFRPIAISTGPDGAIYFCDWHNPIIGHMQHHLRDPNRDKVHGRIYRITYEGRPLLKPARIHGQSLAALLDLLKEPENQTRELARIELGKHESAQVLAATRKWMDGLKPSDAGYAHHLTEALWVHQWHNGVNAELLRRVLELPDPRARAAAARVLCYWRDRIPDALSIFRKLAEDEHPRVRLEAVRAASFYRTADAAEVALAILKRPMDYYLDYTLKETLRQLQPYWRQAIADGRPIGADNPAGFNRLVGSISTPDLQKLPHSIPVLTALLVRSDLADAGRVETLDAIAAQRNSTRMKELLNAIEQYEANRDGAAALLARLLVLQPSEELKAARDRLAALTQEPRQSEVRQAGWASLALAYGSFDTVWTPAARSPASLTDLVSSIPLIGDADFRSSVYERVRPLISNPSGAFPASTTAATPLKARYIRIELPRVGTLTLAEVQVISGGKNIATGGKARQSSTSNGGVADRAIDGRTDSIYGMGSQTHTEEDSDQPWWEVDLGDNHPIEAVVVWNRREGLLGKRLDGFTLTLLDSARRELFRKAGNPAPEISARVDVGPGNLLIPLQSAAIRAAVSMNRDQETTFAALTELIEKRSAVADAAQGIRVLPRNTWPRARSGAAAQALVEWAKTVPAANRTSQDYIAAIQVASDLAGLLPADQSAGLRRELKELRVAVFVIRTVREQMRYDTPRLVVEAGKPFEIILENDDFMPHNLVVIRPGSREAIGTAASAMRPDQFDSRGRPFVPRNNNNILGASKLLEAGQRETLKLTAPDKEGDYEYVCTYPGHWTSMWGWLIVTKDVDAYLLSHPEAVLPAAAAGHSHPQHGLE